VTLHIEDLLAFSESLADPGKIREHHAMRIAVKRLRYTLEVWRDLFGDDLGKEIDTLKGLQDLLGDLHDCDVWIGYLPEFLREEELRCSAFFGNEDHFRSLVPGIEALIRERRERRRQLHETALTTWRDLAFRHFWDTLREKLLMPLTGRREGPFRIGLLANISGDAGALRRVLADGRSRGVSLFLNAGDTLGSPRASRETVEILRKEGILSVAGDRDRVIPGGVSPAGDGGVAGGRDSPERQSKITRIFIRALPTSLRLSFAGERVLLTHGSPASSTGCLDEKVPDGVLCQLAQEAGVSAIVTGNSPAPFERKVCDVLLVGPGSVAGIDGEAGPSSYAILEIVAGGRMTVSHHRIGPGETGLSGAPIPLPPLPTRDTTGA
jgi:predicted phosphodiesterase